MLPAVVRGSSSVQRVTKVRVLLVALALVASLVTACSGDDDSAASTSTTRPRATTTTSSTTTTTTAPASTTSVAPTTAKPTPCSPPVGGSVTPQTSPMPSDVMVLTTVKSATKGCTDTLQFDFNSSAAQAPGYRVEYRAGPFEQDPSGTPVAVAGRAFLLVRLEPATGFDFINNRQSYTGPKRIPINGAYATEAVLLGDFESVMTWVIGVREQVPFAVHGSASPHRMTISIG